MKSCIKLKVLLRIKINIFNLHLLQTYDVCFSQSVDSNFAIRL